MIQSVDNAVLSFFGELQSPFLTLIMKAVVLLTDGGLIWILLGIALLFFSKTRRTGVTSLSALIISSILCNLVLKVLFDRTRPFEAQELELLISIPYGSSFPSGHTTTSVAAALALWLQNRKVGYPALAFSVLVGLSRLYFQVHYLSDVLAGAVSGVVFALMAWVTVNAVYKRLVDRKA